MNPWGRRLSLLLAIMLAMPALCRAADRNEEPSNHEVRGLLYRIRHEDIDMYLLGSIHIGNEEMYPFGEDIRRGMAAADIFVFECDTTSQEAMAETLAAISLPKSTTLSDRVSPECYALLEEVCRQKGYPLGFFNGLQPWAVMTALALEVTSGAMGAEDAGKAMALGVEQNVMAFAVESQGQIAYLETTREQLDTISCFSQPLQEYLLAEQLRIILDPSQAKGLDADIDQWPAYWQAGDAQAFADSYWEGRRDITDEDELALADEYHDALITNRNLLMADRLETMLTDGGVHVYFVTIGLLHLALPEDSVLTHLESRGYKVERIGQP